MDHHNSQLRALYCIKFFVLFLHLCIDKSRAIKVEITLFCMNGITSLVAQIDVVLMF